MTDIQERRRQSKKRRQKELALRLSALAAVVVLSITGIFFLAGQKPETQNSETPTQQLGGNTENSQDTQVTEPTEEESPTLQVVMVGDMLMHDKIIESGKKEDGSYNFDHLFANVKDTIQAADLAIVNQETIMGGEKYGYSGYPQFNTPQALAQAEEKAGFDLLLMATNHTMDQGKNAVVDCMNYLEENCPGLDYIGIHQSKEQQERIYIYEENGIKVAVLNYTYGLNGYSVPSDKPYLVNLLKEKQVIEDIKAAEEQADFTILCPHWGTEYKLEASSEQKRWVKIFAEYGVDLVLGAHPHVIEPVEWVTHENGNKMLVYYSLGNFVNGTSSTGSGVTNRMVGGIADVTIGRNEAGNVEVMDFDAIPIVCHIGEGSDYSVYYLEEYTEEMAKENLILKQDQEFSKDKCQSLVDSVWTQK